VALSLLSSPSPLVDIAEERCKPGDPPNAHACLGRGCRTESGGSIRVGEVGVPTPIALAGPCHSVVAQPSPMGFRWLASPVTRVRAASAQSILRIDSCRFTAGSDGGRIGGEGNGYAIHHLHSGGADRAVERVTVPPLFGEGGSPRSPHHGFWVRHRSTVTGRSPLTAHKGRAVGRFQTCYLRRSRLARSSIPYRSVGRTPTKISKAPSRYARE
jgi:hypothetical protein